MVRDERELEEELGQFHGTQNYYGNFTGLLYTDGIRYLAERGECYWLIDLVGSYQPDLRDIPFQLWSLEVRDDKSALVTMVEDKGVDMVGGSETGAEVVRAMDVVVVGMTPVVESCVPSR